MKVVVKTNSPIVGKLTTPIKAEVSGIGNTPKAEKIVIRTTSSATSSLGGTQRATASLIGIQGPAGTSVSNITLQDISNIDLSGLQDGAVLVYSTAAGKWIAQTTLTKQQIDIGDETF